jgi:hypothetical protein
LDAFQPHQSGRIKFLPDCFFRHGKDFHTMRASLLIRFLPFSALAITACLLSGCGGSADSRVIVTGTVTYKNQPLTFGRLKLFNTKGEQVSGCSLKSDGTFAATDIPLGDIKVTVDTTDSIGIAAGKAPPGTPPMPGESPGGKSIAIPAKYKDVATSGLNYTINAANQKIEIKLD